jgi:Zn-dependent peptidase ImmA (M78 family)
MMGFEDADEDRRSMTKFVSYVSDEAIEKDAQALLAEYAQARGVTIEAPIPIDDIVEKHLKIGIEFDDMHRRFGVPRSGIGFDPDILGAIYFDQKRIVIDESLDPDAYPAKEGRYRFTLAHEGGGHWRLHRHLFGKDPAQTSPLDATPPSVICRTSHANARIELQADLYASCLLMPRKLIFAAWDEAFPDRKQRVLQPFEPIDHPFVEIARFESRIPGAVFTESDVQALESLAKPFAEKFLVSPIAMRIRLEKLGLLHRTVPLQRLLSDGP